MDITTSPLLTDLYEITMAYGYWRHNMAERPAVFSLYYRSNPFQKNYTIACGLGPVIEYLQKFRFHDEDIAYLSGLTDTHMQPLFSDAFLKYLRELVFACDIDAMVEGEIVFPHEPILRIQGPLLQCQILETALLNFINFSTLIATKAAQICQAAKQDPVVEFGLRRAHGPNGGLLASRSAFIGGCESTSNLLAGKMYTIPVRGTMAHSWVMAFENELTAFEKFSETFPSNTLLLIDTYDTIQGIKNAIKIGAKLKKLGHTLLAVRLDSGDLYRLSVEAREMLNAAGLVETKIMASGDLSEDKIQVLKQKNAPIDAWGVGTQLTTAFDHPALNTAYKLNAIQDEKGNWKYKLKRSEDTFKMTNPGILQVRRYYAGEKMLRDVIYDVRIHALEKTPEQFDRTRDLLIPIFKAGQLVYEVPTVAVSRAYCISQLQKFSAEGFLDYPVAFDRELQSIKEQLLLQIQGI